MPYASLNGFASESHHSRFIHQRTLATQNLVTSSLICRSMRRHKPPLSILAFGAVGNTVPKSCINCLYHPSLDIVDGQRTSTDGASFHRATLGIINRRQERGNPAKRCEQLIVKDDSSQTHFWPASINRYLRSSSVGSGVFMLTNVVAMPVFPLRPVRPI